MLMYILYCTFNGYLNVNVSLGFNWTTDSVLHCVCSIYQSAIANMLYWIKLHTLFSLSLNL